MSFTGTVPGNYSPCGFEQLNSLATAAGLTPPAGARWCTLQAPAQHVRFRDDGTAPTSTVGQVLLVGNDPLVYAGDLDAIQFIETAAGGTVEVHYYS